MVADVMQPPVVKLLQHEKADDAAARVRALRPRVGARSSTPTTGSSAA